MFEKWIYTTWEEAGLVLLSTVVTYSAILAYTRITGLRSFSKMSAADFAMTVAVGSLFASTISAPSPSLLIGLVAIGALFTGQWILAWSRNSSSMVSQTVDNQPLLLMAGDVILDQNLKRANVTREDLYGKLREANALNYSEVLAVVFETTGDVSVLHSQDENAKLESDFFKGVIGAERLFASE